jgi:hypothetical protein
LVAEARSLGERVGAELLLPPPRLNLAFFNSLLERGVVLIFSLETELPTVDELNGSAKSSPRAEPPAPIAEVEIPATVGVGLTVLIVVSVFFFFLSSLFPV